MRSWLIASALLCVTLVGCDKESSPTSVSGTQDPSQSASQGREEEGERGAARLDMAEVVRRALTMPQSNVPMSIDPQYMSPRAATSTEAEKPPLMTVPREPVSR
jgi:hypothetical protein